MASLKDLAESRAAVLNFDPRKLKIKPGLNARDFTLPENIAHVEWLCASITEEGVKKPLEVFKEGDDVFVADGESRYRAVMMAIENGVDIQTIPCIPELRGTNDADRVLNQIVSNSGKRLTPLEEGKNIKRAIGFGMTVEQIAAKLGKSRTHVNRLLDFMEAPSDVHTLVKEGSVSASLAAEVVSGEGVSAAEVIKAAVERAKASGRSKATKRDIVKEKGVGEEKHAKAVAVVLDVLKTMRHPQPGDTDDANAIVDKLIERGLIK